MTCSYARGDTHLNATRGVISLRHHLLSRLLLIAALSLTWACGTSIRSLNERADEAAERGDIEAAIRDYRTVFKRSNRSDMLIARKLGLLYHRRGQIEQAARFLDLAAAAFPKDRAVREAMAELAFTQGNYSLAGERYGQLLLDYPGDGALRMAMAQVSFVSMRFKEAEEQARRALRDMTPPTMDGYVLLGRACLSQGKVDQAEAAYGEAMRLAPESPVPPYYLGRLYDLIRMPAEAVEHLERAIKLNPTFVEALRDLGTAHIHQRAYDKAVAALHRARVLAPDDLSVLNNLGIAHRLAGDLEAARAVFRQALEVTGDSRIPYVNLADTYLQAGDFKSAVRETAHLVELKLATPEDLLELEKLLVLLAYHETICTQNGSFDKTHFNKRLADLRAEIGVKTEWNLDQVLPSILNDVTLKVILDRANQACLTPEAPSTPPPAPTSND